MDWQGIWDTIVNFFRSNGWVILGFFLTLIFGIVFIKILMNITRRVFTKSKMEKIAQQFILAIIKFLLYLVLVLILLSIIGIQVSGIITALSAVLLAVGMALEDNIANLANGIVIVATHMFKKGDYIIVDGVEGSITDINFLFTTLITPDNKRITLPNSKIVNNAVTNTGAFNTRRVDFTFSVAYESDVEQVKSIILNVMKSNGNVYDEDGKRPFCRLKVLGSSSIDFVANCWCDSSDYWDTYYYIVENVYNEFKKAGVSIPYSQLEVRERNDKVVMPYIKADLPERVEKKRDTKKKFDLETADLGEIFASKKEEKEKKKQAKKAEKEAKKKAKQNKNDLAEDESKEIETAEVDDSKKDE